MPYPLGNASHDLEKKIREKRIQLKMPQKKFSVSYSFIYATILFNSFDRNEPVLAKLDHNRKTNFKYLTFI